MEVRDEDELEERIAELEHRIQHESLTLAEEKKVLQRIKNLEKSRATLREVGQRQVALEIGRTEREELNAVVSDLRSEAEILRAERDLAYEGVKKFSRERDLLKKQIDAIVREREELAAKKDAAYEEMKAAQDEIRSKDNDFYRREPGLCGPRAGTVPWIRALGVKVACACLFVSARRA